jgi:hypothetical protein
MHDTVEIEGAEHDSGHLDLPCCPEPNVRHRLLQRRFVRKRLQHRHSCSVCVCICVCVCVCGLSEVAENEGIAFAVVDAGRQRLLQLARILRLY